jgi:hypothetical protein
MTNFIGWTAGALILLGVLCDNVSVRRLELPTLSQTTMSVYVIKTPFGVTVFNGNIR